MASSAFVKAMSGSKAAIRKMKDAKPREYTRPSIENGTYIFAVDAEIGVTPNKEAPYIKFNWSIQDDGPEKNKSSNSVFFTQNDDPDKEAQTLDNLALAFKALLDLEELNVQDAVDLEDLVAKVNEEKCYCRGKLKNWGDSEKGGFNVYFQEKLIVE